MVKVYVDSNCYILFAQGKLPQFGDILDLKESGKIKIFYQPNLRGELLRKPSIPKNEKLKLQKILEPLGYREVPFAIGISRVGGFDYISRFSNRKEKATDITIQGIREGISKAMFSTKKFISNSDKEDLELYSEAVNLGCKFFITENTRDFGKAKSKKRQKIENFDVRVKPICKIRSVDEFLTEISSGSFFIFS